MKRRDSGLTLLEVLVATALLAVFFSMVYTIVASTVAERDKIEADATPYAVGPAVMDLVTEDLRAALIEPYKDYNVFHAESETDNGEACTKLDFVTVVPSRARVRVQDDLVSARINEVGYHLRRSETAQGFYALYRREDMGVDGDPLLGGKFYKLADRVKVFRVDFFADDPGDPSTDDAKGEVEWDAKTEKRLPFGCRVTVTLVGETPTDGTSELPEYTFVAYVLAASRHDKSDQQQGASKN